MRKRWNGFAVAGFVMSFTNCLLGLIFSVIGVSSAAHYNERGKGLAIAGIVISFINIIITTIAIICLCVALTAIIASVSELPNILPNNVVDRSRETVIETYAKSQYEDVVYRKEGTKKLKKNAKKGYTFTVEDMDKDASGIKEIYKSCDLKETKVTVYPVAPYGKSDYTIKTNLSCN
jgi:uncharacterized membrane protein